VLAPTAELARASAVQKVERNRRFDMVIPCVAGNNRYLHMVTFALC